VARLFLFQEVGVQNLEPLPLETTGLKTGEEWINKLALPRMWHGLKKRRGPKP